MSFQDRVANIKGRLNIIATLVSLGQEVTVEETSTATATSKAFRQMHSVALGVHTRHHPLHGTMTRIISAKFRTKMLGQVRPANTE